jgi:TolB-like protein/DNA-binding winged helix-turn-helix (wHTH) protein
MSHEITERAQPTESVNPPLLCFGAFEIDPERGEVRKSGVRIKLQEKPFQILAHLVERAGSVVTRDELRQRVWPADTFVDFDANLNTALNKLRQALGDSADNPVFIQTIPRRGYSFIAPVSAGASPPRDTPATSDSAAPPPVATRSRRLPYGILSVTVLMILTFGIYAVRPRLAASAKQPAGRVMLLVMPFEDLSAEHSQEFFAEGLADELISELAQLHPSKLGVIARTTAMQYKDNHKTVDQISRELGVDYLLEGSVRRSSGRVRIAVRLIRTRDQSPVWAENYESDISDVIVVQHEVAKMAVQALPLSPLNNAASAAK